MIKCKKRLATLWFIGSGAIFFVVLFQAIFGKYGDQVTGAWEWFLPTIMPTLSLILSVFIIDTFGKGIQTKTVDRFLFRLTFALSGVYLLVVAGLICPA